MIKGEDERIVVKRRILVIPSAEGGNPVTQDLGVCLDSCTYCSEDNCVNWQKKHPRIVEGYFGF